MRLKIATWNINSVRLRIGLVERFVEKFKPDILCLQEIKCPDANFPTKAFTKLGYPHQSINGQKGYHGVAIVSRVKIEDEMKEVHGGKADHARHIGVTVAKDLRLHNFYVPAGGDIPDPEVNEKFAHKLAYLTDMAAHFAKRGRPPREILVGDLNVAPYEHDVWSHKQLLKIVSHTPVEVDLMSRLRDSRGWTDAARHFVPMEEKLYSWWSYRANDWLTSDRGRRLDHIWTTPNLAEGLTSCVTFKDARGWEQPSDHVPTMITVDT